MRSMTSPPLASSSCSPNVSEVSSASPCSSFASIRVRSSSWYSSRELRGVEVAREALDEGCRQLELLRRDPHRLVQCGEGRLAHLVGPQQGLQHEHVAAHAQSREPRLLPQREPHDRRAVGLLERPAQQHVGLRRGRVRLEVVRAVERQQVDLLARHELDDVDLAAALGGQRVEVLLGEHDRVLAVVVRLVDVGVRHDFAVDLADPLVADAAAVLVVHLVQRHVVVLGRGVHLDRHIHESERQCALPDRSHHTSTHLSHPSRLVGALR